MFEKDPHSLVLKGKYDEAINIYTELINQGMDEKYLSRAIVYLRKGEYDKALSDIKTAEDVRNSFNPDRSDHILQLYGITLWLNKQEEKAAEIWCHLVTDMDSGKIKFSGDPAGGLVNGYLLWFAGCRNRNINGYTENAMNFIRKKSRKASDDFWTNPIARYLLGIITEAELIKAGDSGNDILTSRQLCQAHFYIAINYYLKDDMENYIKNLQACVENGEVTMLEYEVYLAQYELTRV